MNEMAWLEGLFGTIRCANCGANYHRSDITHIGSREEYRFLRCACSTCGSQGVGIVIVHQNGTDGAVASPLAASEPPVGVDDVLSAHEMLQEHQGNILDLFGPQPS